MAGQPTKYQPKFCKILIEHFSLKPYVKKKDGAFLTSDFPTLAGFAIKVGVHRDTLHEWTKHHPEFAEAVKLAKEFQENWLIQNGLRGLVEQPFSIFTAKNVLGWRDKKDIEHSGRDGGPIKFGNLDDKQLDQKIQELYQKLKKGEDSGET